MDSDNLIKYVLGLLNSKLIAEQVRCLNPTINTGSGTIGKLPLCIAKDRLGKVNTIVNICIVLSSDDWDSYETSWDFKRHPLL